MSRVPQIALPALAAVALASALAGPGDGVRAPASPSETAAPAIVFADTEKLVARSCYDTPLRVLIMNGSGTDVAATLELIEAGTARVEPGSVSLVPGRNVVRFTIKPDPLACRSWLSWIVRPAPIAAYLRVRATPNGRRDLRAVRMAELSPVGWLAVAGGLALALLVVKSATPKPLPADLVLTQPIWGSSSASNLGLGTALFTALLGIVPALETLRLADRSTYTQLSLMFAALLAVSPLAFGLRGSKDSIKAFLTAAYLTLWGAFGQLLAGVFLLFDLQAAGALAKPSALIFGALIVWLIGYLVSYTRRAIPRILAPPGPQIRDATGVGAPAARPWNLL